MAVLGGMVAVVGAVVCLVALGMLFGRVDPRGGTAGDARRMLAIDERMVERMRARGVTPDETIRRRMEHARAYLEPGSDAQKRKIGGVAVGVLGVGWLFMGVLMATEAAAPPSAEAVRTFQAAVDEASAGETVEEAAARAISLATRGRYHVRSVVVEARSGPSAARTVRGAREWGVRVTWEQRWVASAAQPVAARRWYGRRCDAVARRGPVGGWEVAPPPGRGRTCMRG